MMHLVAPPRPARRDSRAAGLIAVTLSVALSLTLLAGCSATRRHPAQVRDYPWVLRPPSAFKGDFLWRQKLQARFGLRKLGFQAVLQKKGDTLTLIGLGPAGNKAFVLRQTADKVSFHNLMPRTLPFPARFILIDIQRAWLAMSTQPAPTDGTRTIGLPQERLVETWQGGRLIRRSFVRKNAQPKGQILIDYAPQPTAGSATPGVVVLHNGWFGYELRIETLSAQRL